ncbi:hypothetical protein PIB30_085938 [Stylosanthes scabra]|uniref:FAR1 domain-containing protein n=1 Tax=Stylosanthes scabra TaxID=79078 RepID=A0ABU6TTK6_9FABA|nr:hypothetical protein [Stylosanthes scabra]
MDEGSAEEVNGAESGEDFVGAETEDGNWENEEEGANLGRKSDEEEDASDYDDVATITEKEICKKVFRTVDKAYEFYKRLGRCHGFGVRKGDYVKDISGAIFRRRFLCNRAGLRDKKHYQRTDRVRSHRPETRTNCEAKLSIYYDKDCRVWKVLLGCVKSQVKVLLSNAA